MALNMTPELWRDICAASAAYPTCTIKLCQHEYWVRSFTIEHRHTVPEEEERNAAPPRHVRPTLARSSPDPADAR